MRLRPGRDAHPRIGSAKRLASLVRFVRYAFSQIRSDDHLVHQPIGAGRQTISHARVHIEAPNLEIDHGINVVLLLIERQPALQRTEIGVILGPDREIFAEFAREAGGRYEFRSSASSKAKVDDRIDDEFVVPPCASRRSAGSPCSTASRRIAAWRS